MILLLFGARTGVPFVDFWYGMTAPLIKPFAGMFGSINTFNVYTGQRIELESLVAVTICSRYLSFGSPGARVSASGT